MICIHCNTSMAIAFSSIWLAAPLCVVADLPQQSVAKTVLSPETFSGDTYHAAVASRGAFVSLANLPAMTQQALSIIQAIDEADPEHRAELFRLASDASPSLTVEQRSEIRSLLVSTYLDQPEVLASLSTDEFCLLIDACWDTGASSSLIGDAILAKIKSSGTSQFTRSGDIRILLRALKYVRSNEAHIAKKQLVDRLWESLLFDEAYLQDQDSWDLFKLIQTTASQTTAERGQEFAEYYIGYLFNAGGHANNAVGPVELLTAGRSLDIARKTQQGLGGAETVSDTVFYPVFYLR